MQNWEEIHNNIISLKDEGCSWREICAIINANFGYNLSPEAYRKREERFLKKKLRNEVISEPEVSTLQDSVMDSYKSSDYMNQANAYLRRISREQTCIDIATMFAEKMNRVCKFDDVKIINTKSEKQGILCISDWHYGIEINNYNNTFNTSIAKQRVTQLLVNVIEHIKSDKLSRLVIVNLGDMIAGRIHSQIKMESRIDSVTQIMEVSEIIAEFIQELSNYVKIDYYEVLDNHSRLEPNIKESLELESLARITGFYLKQRLNNNPNVCINDNEYGCDIATFNILGHEVAGVHGNKDKQKVVINSLTMYTHRFYDLILTAHLHHFSADEQNETLRISNGSLMGTDSFAQKIRLNAKPSQTLIVSTPENVVYAIYKIDLE